MLTITRPLPDVRRIVLGGADELFEVELPEDTGKVSVRFITDDGKVALEGDDGDPIGVDYATVDADAWFDIRWAPLNLKNKGRTSVFLASAAGGTTVEILVAD